MANPRALVPLVLALAAGAGACRSQPAGPPPPAPVSADVWAVDDGRQQAGAARRSLGTARPAKSGHETQEVVLRRLGLRYLTDDSTGSQNQDAL